MNRFKIGQEVLIKAHVIDNNLNNLKLNIDKLNGTNETINYVDVDSVVDNCNFIDLDKLDPIVKKSVVELIKRSKVGIAKYGTTLAENNTDDFLQHLKEELMDGINYINKLQSDRREY